MEEASTHPTKKCDVYDFLDHELPTQYYKDLFYEINDNLVLHKMGKLKGELTMSATYVLGVLECSWWYEGVGGGDGGGSGDEWHWWMVVVDDGGVKVDGVTVKRQVNSKWTTTGTTDAEVNDNIDDAQCRSNVQTRLAILPMSAKADIQSPLISDYSPFNMDQLLDLAALLK
ncbi:hypothetical protein Tco_1447198 [Tanacetum coccineum]